MIHNDLSTQLQLLLKTSAPPLLEVSQQQLELPQLVPGQKVPAHVIANLPNGRFQVLIADKTLDMNLPRNTQPGDTLELAFVTARPRLTFVLASDLANAASASNVASTAAKPQVSLSETARFLGGLLEKITQPETRQATTSNIAQTAPLLSGAPVKTLDFAQALRGALTQSGLFYESHQAQWVTGQRPLTDLLHEPQGRLSPAATSLMQLVQLEPGREKISHLNTLLPVVADEKPASQIQHDVFSGKPPAVAQPPAMPNTRAAELQAAYSPRVHGVDRDYVPGYITTPGMPGVKPEEQQTSVLPQNQIDVSSSGSGKPLASTQPAHPDTLPIVRQQLEAIDSRQVMWQGQVWPGQTMEWQIEERSARTPGSEMITPEWQTSLHLVLPQLGEISARLMLQPNGIRVQLDATDPASASLLAEQRAALQQGMEASGLQLVEMKVSHERQEAAG